MPAERPVDEAAPSSPTRNTAPALADKAPKAKKARNRAATLWLTGIGLKSGHKDVVWNAASPAYPRFDTISMNWMLSGKVG